MFVVEMFSVEWWSTTVQFVGTVVTGGGLFYAWNRASRFWDRTWPSIKRQWGRLWGRSTGGGGLQATATTVGTGTTHADVFVGLNLDRALPVEQQLQQVQEYINTRLPEQTIELSRRILEVQRALSEARTESAAAVERATADARTAIDELERRLDATQALDLTWAIVGLAITAVGTFINYFSAATI